MSKFTKHRKKIRTEQLETKRRGDELSEKLKSVSENPEGFIKDHWKNVYKLPLHKDEWSDYVWAQNNIMAMSFFREDWDDEIVQKIIDIVNGNLESDFEREWTAEGCDIFYKKEYAFCVRGWGELRGGSALNMSEDVAAMIQDGFIEYILTILNGDSENGK